ncbi:MAG: SDR family NAD(P)-dependent oxidoreductase [Marivibrio sp.]|uniref:SDR family NAD(P)-dependent oxidoreductase n=1 Tax=Marivibrio sp. TaxID=2039719 RepID=UPI0032EB8537
MTTPRSPLWIVGASQGIGEALALHAARAGAQVAISARSEDKLKAVAEKDKHGRIQVFPCDVTDASSVAEAVAAIEKAMGPIGTAVLNAGTHKETPVDDFHAADVERIFGLNVFGTATVLEVLMPKMVARKRGHLALVSSVAGYRGLPKAAAYCGSKAAVIAMAESLKAELDGRGVKMQVICPGFVRTPLTDQNDFEMPYLMEPEDAAERIWDGLKSDRFEIAFPTRFVMQLKTLRALPPGVYFPLIRKATGVG